MSRNDAELERQREAFAAVASDGRATGRCPETDRIWQAVAGELNASDTSQIVDHVAGCHACAQAWRIAREMAPPATSEAADSSDRDARRPGGSRSIRWIALAAALVATVVGIQLWMPERGVERSGGEREIQSLLTEEVPLARDRFVLRWRSDEEPTSYRVVVTTEDLEPVATGEDLEAASYTVPAERLAALPKGTRLLWRVEATWPEGGPTWSPTYVAILD